MMIIRKVKEELEESRRGNGGKYDDEKRSK